MSDGERVLQNDLRCRQCGDVCGFAKGCRLYDPVDEPHSHCPGGLTTYFLCLPCEEKCLEVHRPIAPDGTWKWIHDCGDKTCGYCKAVVAELVKIYGRWPL